MSELFCSGHLQIDWTLRAFLRRIENENGTSKMTRRKAQRYTDHMSGYTQMGGWENWVTRPTNKGDPNCQRKIQCYLYSSVNNIIRTTIYIYIYIQWDLRREPTVPRDQPPIRDHCCSNIALHFYTIVPAMKHHLSHKTTFCGPVGWSLSSQVSLYTGLCNCLVNKVYAK